MKNALTALALLLIWAPVGLADGFPVKVIQRYATSDSAEISFDGTVTIEERGTAFLRFDGRPRIPIVGDYLGVLVQFNRVGESGGSVVAAPIPGPRKHDPPHYVHGVLTEYAFKIPDDGQVSALEAGRDLRARVWTESLNPLFLDRQSRQIAAQTQWVSFMRYIALGEIEHSFQKLLFHAQFQPVFSVGHVNIPLLVLGENAQNYVVAVRLDEALASLELQTRHVDFEVATVSPGALAFYPLRPEAPQYLADYLARETETPEAVAAAHSLLLAGRKKLRMFGPFLTLDLLAERLRAEATRLGLVEPRTPRARSTQWTIQIRSCISQIVYWRPQPVPVPQATH